MNRPKIRQNFNKTSLETSDQSQKKPPGYNCIVEIDSKKQNYTKSTSLNDSQDDDDHQYKQNKNLNIKSPKDLVLSQHYTDKINIKSNQIPSFSPLFPSKNYIFNHFFIFCYILYEILEKNNFLLIFTLKSASPTMGPRRIRKHRKNDPKSRRRRRLGKIQQSTKRYLFLLKK